MQDRKIFKIAKHRAISKRIFSLIPFAAVKKNNALAFMSRGLFLFVQDGQKSIYWTPGSSVWLCLLVNYQRGSFVSEEVIDCKYKSEIVYIAYEIYVIEKKDPVPFIVYKNLKSI